MMRIAQTGTAAELAAARELIQEYADGLGIDLAFQGFADEFANLPGDYAPPRGRLLVAWEDEQAVGCVALRPHTGEACEMKRMYVRPEARGRAIGRALTERIIAEARTIGYSRMLLDTLPFMTAAIRLYESLGFVRRAAYNDTSFKGMIYMELLL
jgi:GNAT superfamily N-acetyltransferase